MIPVLQLRGQNLDFRLLEGVTLYLLKHDGIDCDSSESALALANMGREQKGSNQSAKNMFIGYHSVVIKSL